MVIHAAATTAEKATLEEVRKKSVQQCEQQDKKLAKRATKVRSAVFTHAVYTL